MMFIIANKNPEKAVEYLVTHTNKRFYFKQLIELGQLICSAGLSNEYKKVYRGKEIQNWIKQNTLWTYMYYRDLLFICKDIFKTQEAYNKCLAIQNDLGKRFDSTYEVEAQTAIFRYKMGYRSNYRTNSELPIDIACNEYRNYIEQYKFKKED